MNTISNVIDNIDIIDKMPIGILVLRRDLVVVSWNLLIEQWTGLKKSDIVDKDITHYYPHIKQARYFDRIKDIFDGGPPVVFSSLFHRHFLPCCLPNGDLRIQHTTVVPVKTHDNEILAAIAIEDVTELTKRFQDIRDLHKNALMEIEERKNIEKALQKSESKIKAIVDTAMDAIITIEETCIIKSANPAAEEIFGYTLQELIGHNANMLIPEIYRIEHEDNVPSHPIENLRKIIGRGKENQAVRKDGSSFPIELSISEVSLKDGVIFTGIIRDITERKHAEEEREKLILELRNALSKIRILRGLLPICSSCKNIRNDEGYWEQIEIFIRDRSEADFSHSICPECANKLYPKYHKIE